MIVQKCGQVTKTNYSYKNVLLYISFNFWLYILVRAQLRVLYGKYSARGEVEWQIQHKVYPSDPTPRVVFLYSISYAVL